MSFNNPTPLRVGMVGTLFDQCYRVAGRVVLGMQQDGQSYFWNEFNLKTTAGESATLVFEPTERGGEWRLFTLFEPEYPLTAEDAATKRVGHPLNLDGTDVRVTLVDQSRVFHIEGEAPEGVEVGDVAHYFNAEGENTLLVVSWTGDEVECYRGVDLSYAALKSAFGLHAGAPGGLSPFQSTLDSSPPFAVTGVILKLVALLAAVALVGAVYALSRPPRQPGIILKLSAPAMPLTLGSTGILAGKTCSLRGHAVVEVAQVGRRYAQHEYQLFEEDGTPSLLIYGFKPGVKDWFLFTPLQPLNPPTPQQAAAKQVGDIVELDSQMARVRELFQATIRQTDSAEATDSKNGTVLYGFAAESGSTLLLVRWNEKGLAFYQGKTLAKKEVEAAFARTKGK